MPAHRGITQPVAVKTTTVEQLAVAVVKSLKNKDEPAFISLVPSKPEMTRLLETSEMKGDQKAELLSNMNSFVKRMIDEARPAFKKTIAEGEASGLNWAHAVYSKCHTEYKNKDGIATGVMEIMLTASGKSYIVTLGNIVKIDNGWKTDGRIIYGTVQQQKEIAEKNENARRDSVVKRTVDALKARMADTTKK